VAARAPGHRGGHGRCHDRGVPAPADFPGAVDFPDGTRTAADAAAAIGCDVGAIVKSLVFRRGEDTVLVLCSGANTVDADRLELARADAAHVRAVTGCAIGGVPPYGWARAPDEAIVDEDLLAYDEVWAAAGTPRSVFPLAPDELIARCGGEVASVRPGP
jgi:prolyl-tRNA editing enzyme YbaK/EbsC (Cys-tRNA(Pro) deacylase)